MNGLSSSSSLGVADAGQDARSPRGLRHTPMFMCCLGRGLHASQLPCRLHYSAVAPPPHKLVLHRIHAQVVPPTPAHPGHLCHSLPITKLGGDRRGLAASPPPFSVCTI